ncbi:MAG: flagellar motor switch protein FliG, partial [Porticoccaceae bacterium]|nr:flagellar motor switch protein FliG [Porticoccaceae bacterium]
MAKNAKKKGAEEEAPKLSAMDIQFNAMPSQQRAAVLMLLLGEEQAADIMQFLNRREVNNIGKAMVEVQDLSRELVGRVVDDFVDVIKDQTDLGMGATDYVVNVLNAALGEDKAATVLAKIMPAGSAKELEILQWMDPRAIGEILMDEHPQVSAIILSVLDSDVASQVLSFLPNEKHAEIIERLAKLDSVQPSAMAELEGVLSEKLIKTSAKASNLGGIVTAAKIMNFSSGEVVTGVFDPLTEKDEELATEIQNKMLTFENLAEVDNRSIQTLLRNVEQDLLMPALKGADEATKEKILSNMSARARVLLIDDMEAKGPMRLAEVEDAQ